jgi:uncharacterized protein
VTSPDRSGASGTGSGRAGDRDADIGGAVGAMANELIGLVWSSPWLVRVLGAVRDSSLPDAWVGAGVLRDLVWGERYGSGFRPDLLRDIDVAFFDPHDVSRAGDDRATDHLTQRLPDAPWEAKNQAAVHTWYPDRFGGGPVEPFTGIRDAVGTWPETATAVAVRLSHQGAIEVCAPLGLEDLLGGVWRRNPAGSASRSHSPGSPARIPQHGGRE